MTRSQQQLNPSALYQERFGDVINTVDDRLGFYLSEAGHAGGGWPDLDRRLDGDPNGPGGLWEAMRYSALSGGKRIRPVLAIESCLACDGKLETILPAACAIEMVHAQSLIHDDLPCMDDDDLRRGKPTLHKAFDEATAVLAGDALLAMAFGIVARFTPLDGKVTAETVLRAAGEFSDVSSVYGLVNGQYVDIRYEGKTHSQDVLEYIHACKTGALFTFCTRVGAMLAGADAETVDAFTQFGRKIGLAFQIVDDLLDIQSTAEVLGKTAGKDIAQQKATYPAFFGVEASRKKAAELTGEAEAILTRLAGQDRVKETDGLLALARFIHMRIN